MIVEQADAARPRYRSAADPRRYNSENKVTTYFLAS